MPPLPDLLPIPPFTRPARGEIALPGSKSLTNRALLLAALCDEPVTLTGALFSEDTHLMTAALRGLGFRVEADERTLSLRVSGQSNGFTVGEADVFVGLAGTAARFLTALCAAAPRGTYRIDGVPQMRQRPMKGLIDALRALGADIRCIGAEGFFPLEIRAHGLHGGRVPIDARESSQMLSALLMVAPLAGAPVEIVPAGGVRWPFVRMTMNLMRLFGHDAQPVAGESGTIFVGKGKYHIPGGQFPIEGDATAASYFIALPVVTGGSVQIPGYRLAEPLQGDTKFSLLLEDAGLLAPLDHAATSQRFARGLETNGLTADFSAFSDTFLTLAAIAPLLRGPTRITGIAHTRKQETDRVAGMARELTRLGQRVIETEDTLEIHPQPLRSGQVIETYGDHRFAMSFGILGCHDLHGDGRPWLTIRNPACCAKTFPNFFELLETLRQQSLPPLMGATSPFIIVAIDGGAASGKSSTSRTLSERFHLLHVDTGSFYRAVTAELLRCGVDAHDLAAVRRALPALRFGTQVVNRSALMEIGGRIVPDTEIRSAAVNASVASFAAIPEVRAALLDYQRGQAGIARAHGFRGLVMEGRDIGSKIFPDADLRFFLFADPEERERRRQQQGLQDHVAKRDTLDSQRLHESLQGATLIDSTFLTLDQVVEQMASAIAARLQTPPAPAV
jgi:3-phosphoshikimate 1-carboxyvinyltransferase